MNSELLICKSATQITLLQPVLNMIFCKLLPSAEGSTAAHFSQNSRNQVKLYFILKDSIIYLYLRCQVLCVLGPSSFPVQLA